MNYIEQASPRAKMKALCHEAAAPNAASVDKDSRFPSETLAALKRERLMALLVPVELGGKGASLTEVADLCCVLAQSCASSGMIYAMHNIKQHNLVAGGASSAWHRDFMKRVAAEQLLLASATTETGIGGDLRNSVCAVERKDGEFSLVKDATVISYARQADAIFATARRNPEAASSDQVMVALTKEQYELKPTTAWDTLGMRGTCSEGFILSGKAPEAQIFPQPFAELAAQSMLATSHTLWAAVWYGIAQDAVARAQAMVRGEARKKPDVKPASALPLAEANIKLQQLRSSIKDALDRFERAKDDADLLGSVSFAAAMNNLKVTASRLASELVLEALRICGIQGYRNDSPFSVGRHLRDVLSAPLMIANDRIVSNLSSLVLMTKMDASLSE
jgi:acyl-CoA dehydrogenase